MRVVVLDCVYGCVQAALDLSASDVGAPLLDPSQPVQVGRPAFRVCSIYLHAHFIKALWDWWSIKKTWDLSNPV